MGEERRLSLVRPPLEPRHGTITPLTLLVVRITSRIAPEVEAEIRGENLLLATPQVVLAELAGQIADGAEPRTREQSWMHALVAGSGAAPERGELVFWTWTKEGLLAPY